jgi:uncharacterized membrane protein
MADKPHRIESTLEIDVPVSTAYDQWTQFESFPEFMEGVEEVRQLDDKRLHWVASVAGQRKEWESEIVDQQPDKYIAWRALAGDTNHGSVSFESLGPDRCRVTLLLTYQPESLTEKVGSALGIVKARVEGDLRRFKEFIESRGVETGAWRGSIERGRVGERPTRPRGPVHGEEPAGRTRPGRKTEESSH